MSASPLDAVALQMIWSRLISIANEQQAALIHTGFSTVLRESEDLACGVFDPRGLMVAQSVAGTPGHINSMATGVQHLLEAFEEEGLEKGDVLITNDPWLTAGQVNDLTVATPVFVGQRIVGMFASTCHSPDIGGRRLSAEARDVYEEGLRIPIMKLARAGVLNEPLLAIIRENVRTPEETVGDIFAQMTSNEVGAKGLIDLLAEFDLDTLIPIADEVMARSEAAMRDAISRLPDGTYTDTSPVESADGMPVRLRVELTVDGDELKVDYAGTSEQVSEGINVVLNYTRAYTSFGIKALLAPEVPHNEGSFRPVTVVAPEGSILNCVPPASVAGRSLIGHLLPGMVMRALFSAVPDKVLAGGAEALWITIWGGSRDSGEGFSQTLFNSGGTGARKENDGLTATCFPSGVASVPTEVIEMITPLKVLRRSLREGSAGAGRTRGGHGQVIEISNRSGIPWTLSPMIGRTTYPAAGLEGGKDGLAGACELEGGGPLVPKRQHVLEGDAVVRMSLPGGAGRGDPKERNPEAVLADVIDGYVSLEDAREVYLVAIEYGGDENALVRPPGTYSIDSAETRALRGQADCDQGVTVS